MSYPRPVPMNAACRGEVSERAAARSVTEWLCVCLAVLPVSGVMFPLLSKTYGYLGSNVGSVRDGLLLATIFVSLGWLACHLALSVSILIFLRGVISRPRLSPLPIVSEFKAHAEQP